MAVKYISGIPFIRISGTVESNCPLGSSWSFNRAQTESLFGMTQEEIGHTFFGSSSNPTLMAVYRDVGSDVQKSCEGLGSLILNGPFIYHSTGMGYTEHGWKLLDANGNNLITGAAVGTTGIYYPNETVISTNQYLVVGLVDSNNHISFGVLFGTYQYSSYTPYLRSDATIGIASGVNPVTDIYPLFEDGDWSDDPTPPSPSEEGGFNLDNRFSPGIATNAIGLYPLTQTQVVDCFDNFWNTTLCETIRNALGIVDTTNELILGLKWFYGIKSDISQVSSNCYVTIANQKFDGDGCKAVSTKPCAKEFCTHDCGTINVPAHFNNYLDFMSKYELYVPFYGYVELNPSDVVGGTVGLKYNINLLTGDALAYITVNNSRSANIDEIAIPISALGVDCPTEHGSLKDTISNSARVIAGAAAAGVGIAAGMRWVSASKIEKVGQNTWKRDLSHVEGEPTNAGMLATSMNNIESLPTVQRGSNVSGSVGYIGPLKPFLIITRPVKATPNTLNDVIGARSCEVAQLSSKHGFVKASAIKPESISTSCKYIDEIISLVQSGVVMP